MAKRRGGGGKSASRSAAAKKGWETRRRGGVKKTIAQRKAAMEASTRKMNPFQNSPGSKQRQRINYLESQKTRELYAAMKANGKGSKAARRVAALNAAKKAR